MTRFICTVFVALAIWQVASAKNLELPIQPIPIIDLYDWERAPTLLGDMTTGEHLAGETIFTSQIQDENNKGRIKSSLYYVTLPKGKRTHYLHAETTSGTSAVICPTRISLNTSVPLLEVRLPTNSQSVITVTVGAH